MIKLNDVEIKLDKYPDGTFLFKNLPPIGGWRRDNIEWFFESMEELTAVEYITRYCWDHRVVPNLYMPYIPDARMDRVKHKNELFTLKYFAQTINSLHFGKVEVLDPHSDVSAALFNKVHVESPIGRGHNILKAIANDIGLPEYETYEELYKALEDEGTVRSIMENDKEIEFKFHARKLEYIALFLKPAIAGADISPFSTKNLPKCDYPIPEEDLAEYNAILDSMDSKDYLLVSRVTDAFLTNKLQKSKQYRTIDLKKDMKKKCLKTKEYINSLGEWNEYIEYLKKEICKCGSKD